MSDIQTTQIAEHLSEEADKLTVPELLSALEERDPDIRLKLKDLYVKVMLEKITY